MYTEKSIQLKSDFYSRFGESHGQLYFERTGLPCMIMGSGDEYMAFSLDCGVRAYGRGYGDILRIMDSDSNLCDVHFVRDGKGAQILYTRDMPNIGELSNTVTYTVNKLLRKMECSERLEGGDGIEAVCGRYGDKGWCAVKLSGEFKSVPLPLNGYNAILIRTRKRRIVSDSDTMEYFSRGEKERIDQACAGLKECRIDTFFDMINQSQESIERILRPSSELMAGVRAAQDADGIVAVKVCDIGVIALCKSAKTDSAVHTIINVCARRLGYAVRVAVVK